MNKQKTFELQVNIDLKLTQQDIDDIMASALEGGITYWCRRAEVVGEYLGEYASDQISRGGVLKLLDAESSDVWELTREKFLEGVKKYVEHDTCSVDGGRIDTCEIDGDAADCIVQYALFGEVVFG